MEKKPFNQIFFVFFCFFLPFFLFRFDFQQIKGAKKIVRLYAQELNEHQNKSDRQTMKHKQQTTNNKQQYTAMKRTKQQSKTQKRF